jgi:regulator of protease activity HflC (stomatin/prohibitin superfamily)
MLAHVIALLLTIAVVGECAAGVMQGWPILLSLAALNAGAAAQAMLFVGSRRWMRVAFIALVAIAAIAAIMAYQHVVSDRQFADNPVVPLALAGALLMAACCWTVLRAMVRVQVRSDSLTVATSYAALAGLLWEQTLAALVAALCIGFSAQFPTLGSWCASGMLLWLATVAVEAILRLLLAFAQRNELFAALACDFALRRIVRGEPIAIVSLSRLQGVDANNSVAANDSSRRWSAIVLGGFLLLAVALWGSTGLVAIAPHELGLYERQGQLLDEPLPPGLHLALPYPLSRVHRLPVKRVTIMPVGFVATESDLFCSPLLWTRPHGSEEYPLLVGTGAEAVIVNALVRCQIDARPAQLRQYITQAESPEQMLRSLAHRTLLAELRAVTLDDVLVSDRDGLRQRVELGLRRIVEQYELGLSIIDVGILSIHPPVEVSGAYADIVNARIDAEKSVAEATVFATSELIRCSMMSDSFAADAQAASSQRLATAVEDASRFRAFTDQFSRHPAIVRTRLLHDTLSTVLQQRPLMLIDVHLPKNVQLWLDDPTANRNSSSASQP